MDEAVRRTWWRNALITIAVFGPLGATFGLAVVSGKVVNFYPVPVWNLFVEAAEPANGRVFYVVSGCSPDGLWREVPPFGITGALHNRLHMFASYTDGNLPFKIASPHAENVLMLAGLGRLPEGARMPQLLRAWGEIHNGRLPMGSPNRLTAIRMEARRWPGGDYHAKAKTARVWEVEL
jgi:hypothetical protein